MPSLTFVRVSFMECLAGGSVLVADGATGTNYQAMGLEAGKAPEEWLVDAPERVLELHRAFVEAGSEILLTCSFGGTPLRLADGPLAGKAHAINVRAAELAREVAGNDVFVAGSMGPTGQLCEPLGPLTASECASNYAEQASALAEGGVDLLVLETFFALEEATAAITGVREATHLPLVVTFSFDRGTKTMMGLSPKDVLAGVLPYGLAAVGANCGRSLSDTDAVVEEFVAFGEGTPLWVKPNAGLPKYVDGCFVYDAAPATLASHALRYIEQGVRVVGGCCGTTPAHIAAITATAGERPRTSQRHLT